MRSGDLPLPRPSLIWDFCISIIGIPAVGAHAVETWTADSRDADATELNAEGGPNGGDAQGPFPPISTIETETSRPSSRLSPHIWIIHDVRTTVPKARVILYDHGSLEEGVTLKSLAEGFLRCLQKLRETEVSRLFRKCYYCNVR